MGPLNETPTRVTVPRDSATYRHRVSAAVDRRSFNGPTTPAPRTHQAPVGGLSSSAPTVRTPPVDLCPSQSVPCEARVSGFGVSSGAELLCLDLRLAEDPGITQPRGPQTSMRPFTAAWTARSTKAGSSDGERLPIISVVAVIVRAMWFA